MNKTLTLIGTTFVALGCLSLGACATATKGVQITKAPTGMHQITRLVERATEHQRRSVRKPVREARARAMRQLAVKAGELLAETQTWDSAARLTSIDKPVQDAVRTSVVAFREALTDLEAASRNADISDLRSKHAAAQAAYRRLTKLTDTSK